MDDIDEFTENYTVQHHLNQKMLYESDQGLVGYLESTVEPFANEPQYKLRVIAKASEHNKYLVQGFDFDEYLNNLLEFINNIEEDYGELPETKGRINNQLN
jgi:hypothetical protein